MSWQQILLLFIGMGGSFIGVLAGGGGLIILPAMMLFGIPTHMSIGATKFSSIVAGSSNLWRLIRDGRITASNFRFIAIGGFICGMAGAFITSSLPENILNVLVVILLLFSLTLMFLPKKHSKQPKPKAAAPTPERKEEPKSGSASASGFSPGARVLICAISVYDGLLGAGAATISISTLMYNNFSYIDAVYHTRLLVLMASAGAFVVFLYHGFINWHYAIPLMIGSSIGAQFGFIALPHVSPRAARYGLIIISILLIAQTLLKVL